MRAWWSYATDRRLSFYKFLRATGVPADKAWYRAVYHHPDNWTEEVPKETTECHHAGYDFDLYGYNCHRCGQQITPYFTDFFSKQEQK
jgi:hypothetical protein